MQFALYPFQNIAHLYSSKNFPTDKGETAIAPLASPGGVPEPNLYVMKDSRILLNTSMYNAHLTYNTHQHTADNVVTAWGATKEDLWLSGKGEG